MNGGPRRYRFLAAFALYFGGLWLLWNTPVVYPLKLFVVLLHEVSHGLVAVVTGGQIRAIGVTAGAGGYCLCPGGNAFLTLSAGYLGSLGWGALILAAGLRGGARARITVAAIGAAAAMITLLFVRGPFGLLFGLLFGAALLASARYLPLAANRVVVVALGLTSVLYAILDIKADILDRPGALSDASMLAELTGLPASVWGVLWIAIALAVAWRLLVWAWRGA